jgi:hypothetical protein
MKEIKQNRSTFDLLCTHIKQIQIYYELANNKQITQYPSRPLSLRLRSILLLQTTEI